MAHRALTELETAVLADTLNPAAYMVTEGETQRLPTVDEMVIAWWDTACDWGAAQFAERQVVIGEHNSAVTGTLDALDAAIAAATDPKVIAALTAMRTEAAKAIAPVPADADAIQNAEDALAAKVARWQPVYDKRKADNGENYKNALERYIEEQAYLAEQKAAAKAEEAAMIAAQDQAKADLIAEITAKVKAELTA